MTSETNQPLTTEPSELDWVVYTPEGFKYFIGAEKAPLRRQIQLDHQAKIVDLIRNLQVHPSQLHIIQAILDGISEL